MIKQGNNHIERDGNGMPIAILNYEDFRILFMNTKKLLRHLSIIMFLLFVGVFAQATQVSAKNVKNYSELCAAAKDKDVTTITVTQKIY